MVKAPEPREIRTSSLASDPGRSHTLLYSSAAQQMGLLRSSPPLMYVVFDDSFVKGFR